MLNIFFNKHIYLIKNKNKTYFIITYCSSINFVTKKVLHIKCLNKNNNIYCYQRGKTKKNYVQDGTLLKITFTKRNYFILVLTFIQNIKRICFTLRKGVNLSINTI